MSTPRTLKEWFDTDDNARSEVLDRARLCAALTKPHLLPPEHQEESMRLPEHYQSIGPRGLSNMEGRMLMALFPPGSPWFELMMAPWLRYAGQQMPDVLQYIDQRLFETELLAQGILESANLFDRARRRRVGFRTHKRKAISQILATGETLEHIDDEYRMRCFRREQYVTKRDSSGDPLYHIARERIDPLTLNPTRLELADLKPDELEEKQVSERMHDLFTIVEWQPVGGGWVIRQEINDHEIGISYEPISPFMCTTYELSPGEHYGRGLIEQNLGSLRSLNELELHRLDLLAIAAKSLWAIDFTSKVRDRDLEKPSGSVIRARVQQGGVTDVSMLHAEQVREYGMLTDGIRDKTKELSHAFLIESEIQPQKERVTATQIQRIALELEGALGGVYAAVADEQQVPLLQRVLWQMQKDKMFPPELPDGSVEIRALTGIHALSREVDAQKVMNLAQIMNSLGPEAMQYIHMPVLIDVLARYQSIDEPGLLKTEQEVEAERRADMQAQLQQAAGEQAISTVGNAAQLQLAQAGTEAA